MKWHKGDPPHIGWWRTKSDGYYTNEWRWWDGKRWSMSCYPDDIPKYLNIFSGVKTDMTNIQWSTYYPKNARVPRRKQ